MKSAARKTFVAVLGIILLFQIFPIMASAATPLPPGLKEDEIYFIRNVNSGLYLDVPGGSSANGKDLEQHGFNGYRQNDFHGLRVISHPKRYSRERGFMAAY